MRRVRPGVADDFGVLALELDRREQERFELGAYAFRQIAIVPETLGAVVGEGQGDDASVAPTRLALRIVLLDLDHAERATCDDDTGRGRCVPDDQRIDRIAVLGFCGSDDTPDTRV